MCCRGGSTAAQHYTRVPLFLETVVFGVGHGEQTCASWQCIAFWKSFWIELGWVCSVVHLRCLPSG